MYEQGDVDDVFVDMERGGVHHWPTLRVVMATIAGALAWFALVYWLLVIVNVLISS